MVTGHPCWKVQEGAIPVFGGGAARQGEELCKRPEAVCLSFWIFVDEASVQTGKQYMKWRQVEEEGEKGTGERLIT